MNRAMQNVKKADMVPRLLIVANAVVASQPRLLPRYFTPVFNGLMPNAVVMALHIVFFPRLPAVAPSYANLQMPDPQRLLTILGGARLPAVITPSDSLGDYKSRLIRRLIGRHWSEIPKPNHRPEPR
jgi:hypothetical protein